MVHNHHHYRRRDHQSRHYLRIRALLDWFTISTTKKVRVLIDTLSSIHLQELDRHIGHGSVEREYGARRGSMVSIYMTDPISRRQPMSEGAHTHTHTHTRVVTGARSTHEHTHPSTHSSTRTRVCPPRVTHHIHPLVHSSQNTSWLLSLVLLVCLCERLFVSLCALKGRARCLCLWCAKEHEDLLYLQLANLRDLLQLLSNSLEGGDIKTVNDTDLSPKLLSVSVLG